MQASATEESVSALNRLVQFINKHVPFLDQSFSFVGEELTITHVIVPILFLIILNLFGNISRALLINRVLNRYIDDRKTILSIGNTTKYTNILSFETRLRVSRIIEC